MFSSIRCHNPVPIVCCLEMVVLYILSSFVVVYCRKTSRYSVMDKSRNVMFCFRYYLKELGSFFLKAQFTCKPPMPLISHSGVINLLASESVSLVIRL